ncbi:GNAT family N-acetyltransferase [Salisediminibacterium selenitireducens]|uniref:GCN5-related N-acetyltransferase n=1 Tax=Bacillus selenitireducens (strain ATCC 700615 / DSM 15326 / MLS10) TaxID=439292 RepID=D6XX79_BACIE|nr:GNAT family protein [Salisediminibacterium selenitireducens]ADH97936.1 GCN5-related N-acetyltransferase [[Bacillus] selenitireducens MLS10]
MFYHQLDEDTELRILELRHAEPLYLITEHSRRHLRTWLPWVDDIYQPGDSRKFIEMGLKQFVSQDGFHAGIWYKGQLAGVIGLHGIHWGNRSTSIGYWLGDGFEGKGIMTKACKALIHHCFHDLNLERIEIRAASRNTKSRAIPERLGFQEEGRLRHAEFLYDHFVDHIVYARLKSDEADI